MEFILSQNLEAILPATIDFNYEELKTELAGRLVAYKGLVVSEDGIKDAKKDRAALNALSKAIDDKRKDVKNACLKPYEDVERKAKELVGMIGEAITNIDDQVKAFSDKEKDDKLKSITHFYRDNIGDLSAIVPLEKILPDKWANAGTALISITREIMDSITKIRNDLGIIEKMSAEFAPQITDVYLKTLDMSAALLEKNRLEEQQRLLKARKVAQDAPTQPSAEVVMEVDAAEETLATEAPRLIPDDTSAKSLAENSYGVEYTKDVDVRFYATTDAFRKEMKALTEKHGIKYGRINNG